MEVFILAIAVIGFALILVGLRVVDQYERGVILTLGKYSGMRGAGLNWIFPGLQKMYKVDMRIETVDIPQQEVITKDNVTVGINAVVYFRVSDAAKAILEVQNFRKSVALYAQATLRDVIGGVELDPLLSEREHIAEEIKQIVDVATDPWGIDVNSIKIQDIELPADMKRVMAKQAEAERERRAVIIQAEGEHSASETLARAAGILSSTPGGMSIRTLQTIEKLNPEPNKMVLFTLPIEFMKGFEGLAKVMNNQE